MIKKIPVYFLICLLPILNSCGVEFKDSEDSNHIDGAKPQSTTIGVKNSRPRELVVNEKIILLQNTAWSAERVFLGENAEVITGEFDLVIEAGELHVSPGARIENFSSRADIDKNGRHGGGLTLRAQSASGVLRISLRGEDGGLGRPGAATNYGGHPGCAGGDGRNGGNAGNLIAEFGSSQNFDLQVANEPSLAGTGGVRGSVPKYSAYALNPPCLAETPEGKDGIGGEKGLICIRKAMDTSLECSR